MREFGLEADPHVLDEFSVEAGHDAAGEIVRRGSLPDAVVAGSDINAVGVIANFRDLDVVVPRTVLVTGFDGTQLSELYNPAITTVQHPVAAIARNAVSFVTSRIEEPSGPRGAAASWNAPGASTPVA